MGPRFALTHPETGESLTRSFTSEECATYRIDSYPTLEEIRTRS